MFTGIVREIGRVEKIARQGDLTRICVSAPEISVATQISDSVAVNGVCLTVVAKDAKVLVFEAVGPTLLKTNLKHLKKGEAVNLEPALCLGDKLGGHFVLGHVDSEIKLRRVIDKRQYRQLELQLLPAFRKYLVENGSVTLEGVSLTVKKIFATYFTVDIIPFTYEHTNLRQKRPGDLLNVEFDYLLKQSKTA